MWSRGYSFDPLDAARLVRDVYSNSAVPPEAQKAFGLFAEDLKDAPLSFWARCITAWAVQTHVHSHEVLQRDLERHAVDASELRPPIFIVGLPRTGTTLLHHLLALDPESQCLRAYELMRCTRHRLKPPSRPNPLTDKNEPNLLKTRPGAVKNRGLAMGRDGEPKRKQLTSFLEELKAKHVTASDLSANERQVHVQTPPLKLKRVIDLLANYVAQMGEPFEEAVVHRLQKSRNDNLAGIDWSFLQDNMWGDEGKRFVMAGPSTSPVHILSLLHSKVFCPKNMLPAEEDPGWDTIDEEVEAVKRKATEASQKTPANDLPLPKKLTTSKRQQSIKDLFQRQDFSLPLKT
eukprot:symbB.v1.2.000783.t1/scaffold42.1/size391715/12